MKLTFIICVILVTISHALCQWKFEGTTNIGPENGLVGEIGTEKNHNHLFDEERNKLYFLAGNGISIFDTQVNSIVGSFQLDSYHSATLNKPSNHILINYYDRFDVWDLYSRQLLNQKYHGFDGFMSYQILVDNKNNFIIRNFREYGNMYGSRICFYDLYSNELIDTIFTSIANDGSGLALSERHNKLFVCSMEPNELKIYDLNSRTLLSTIPEIVINRGSYLFVDTLNNYLIIPDFNQAEPETYPEKITIVDLNTNEIINSISINAFSACTFNPIKNEIYIARPWGWSENSCDIYSYPDLDFLHEITISDPVKSSTCMIYNENNNYIYSIYGSMVRVINAETREQIATIKCAGTPNALACDPSRNFIFSRESKSSHIITLSDQQRKSEPKVLRSIPIPNFSSPAPGLIGFPQVHVNPNLSKAIYTSDIENKLVVLNYPSNRYNIYEPGPVDEVAINFNSNETFISMIENQQILKYNRSFDLEGIINTNIKPFLLSHDQNHHLYISNIFTTPEAEIFSDRIYKFDLQTQSFSDSVKIGKVLSKLIYINDSALIAVNNHRITGEPSYVQSTGKIYRINPQDFTRIDSILIDDYIGDVQFFPRYNKLYVFYQSGSRIKNIDMHSFQTDYDQTLEEDLYITSAAINENTNRFYIADGTTGLIYTYFDRSLPQVQHPNKPLIDNIIVGDRQVRLSWQPQEDAINGYNIYRKTESGEKLKMVDNQVQETNWKDQNLTNGMVYSYQVSAVGENFIESTLSDSIDVLPFEQADFALQLVENDNFLIPEQKEARYIFSIQKDAGFNEDINLSIENLHENLQFHISSNPVIHENYLEISISSTGEIPAGRYSFLLSAESNTQSYEYNCVLIISEDVQIDIQIDPMTCSVDNYVTIRGNTEIDPGEELIIISELPAQNLFNYDTVIISENNTFNSVYQAISPGIWQIYARYAAFFSDTLELEVNRMPTTISCSIQDIGSIQLNTYTTLRGSVFPSPLGASLNINITKPDGSSEYIEGILANELGYFGNDLYFNQEGIWKIGVSWDGNEYYQGHASTPLIIPVGNYVNKAIILNAPHPDSVFQSIYSTQLSHLVYKALLSRGLDHSSILYLSSGEQDTTLDNSSDIIIDAPASLDNFENGLRQWLNSGDEINFVITVYINASADSQNIHIGDTEYLTKTLLQSYYDSLLTQYPESDIVIYIDTDYSGSFIPLENENERITFISSTNRNQDIAVIDSGQVAFSTFFWNEIIKGKSVGESFLEANNIIRIMPELFSNMNPLINSDDNTAANQQIDFDISKEIYIGFSYSNGNQVPEILGCGFTFGDGQDAQSADGIYRISKQRAQESGIRLWTKALDSENSITDLFAFMIRNDTENKDIEKINFQYSMETSQYSSQLPIPENFGLYSVYVFAIDGDNGLSDPLSRKLYIENTVINDLNDLKMIPDKYYLSYNYPNPFNSSTVFDFSLPKKEKVVIDVYNILGQKVLTLFNGYKVAGNYSIKFTLNSFSSGLYFIKFNAGRYQAVRKIVLLK